MDFLRPRHLPEVDRGANIEVGASTWDHPIDRSMDRRLDFQFSIPRPPEGPPVEMSAGEMERSLLKRLEAEKRTPTDALWQLARF